MSFELTIEIFNMKLRYLYIFFALLAVSCGPAEDPLSDNWEKLVVQLGQVLGLEKKLGDAPDNKVFGEDKESIGEDLDALLDEAIALLGRSKSVRSHSSPAWLEKHH